MTSLFQKIEDLAEEIEVDVEQAFETAWSDIEQFFTADVAPIIKGAFQYLENNGQADLLMIGKAAFNGAATAVATGGNVVDAVGAAIGTALDEAKSAGLKVAEGAAALAVSMAAAEFNNANPTVSPATTPETVPSA